MAGLMLLPPRPGTCPVCGIVHLDDEAHNAQSLYYQTRFFMIRGRYPTWADAIAHCAERVRTFWRIELESRGAWTEPPAGVEPIADPPAESFSQVVGIGDGFE